MGQRDRKGRTEAVTENGNREILPEGVWAGIVWAAGFMAHKNRKDISPGDYGRSMP
ncbi:MAG: hypothetical protein LBE13_03520 [Bacteroidales bacterium]|nr:hypothetical protein [Bacteroidales bacterium]